MSAPITELLPDEVVRSITDEVWVALLEEFVVPAEQAPVPAAAVRASVAVRGPWNGLVTLTCSAGAAEDLTRSLLGLSPDEPVLPEDVEDAFGEVANVLGGNVKAVLPGPSSLGLPEVGEPLPDAAPAQVRRLDVLWRDHPLTIAVRTAPHTDEKDEVLL